MNAVEIVWSHIQDDRGKANQELVKLRKADLKRSGTMK